jgi:hypothetical protein
MGMEMLPGMGMFMKVERSVGMGMHVGVLSSSEGPSDPPDRVEEPEEDEPAT